MQKSRVLLAHRDEAVQEMAARALTRIGVTLDVVTTSAEAVSRIERESYAVIVLEHDEAILGALGSTVLTPRPVVIVTTTDKRDLDADIVSLVVPEPYDPLMLVGVILACVTPELPLLSPETHLPAVRGDGQIC